jgi:hypothetical protein
MSDEPPSRAGHDERSIPGSLPYSFIASGFVVSGWARDDDFDYATWTPRSSEENDACP